MLTFVGTADRSHALGIPPFSNANKNALRHRKLEWPTAAYRKCYIIVFVSAGIAWMGDSKEVLSSFPSDVKSTLGFNLRRLQNGRPVTCDSRPMPSIGPGVYELQEYDDATRYRVMYLAKVEDTIYVCTALRRTPRKLTRVI